MIRFRNTSLYSILASVIIFIFLGIGTTSYYLLKVKKKKLNILILSTCSLSANRLGFSGTGTSTPNIDKTAAKSFVFDNAFTDMSWSNVSGFLSKLTISELKEFGYHALGRPWGPQDVQRNRTILDNVPPYFYRLPYIKSHAEQTYANDLVQLKEKLLNKEYWPFLVEVHNKVMHFPYTKGFDVVDIPLDTLISQESNRYIAEYKKNIKKFPERLPFGLFLSSGEPESFEEMIRVLKIKKSLADKILKKTDVTVFVGVLNDKNILNKWKKSKYFPRDLSIVKEIYDKRLELYDKSIADILKLYDDSDLTENTVFIYTGDHGEAFFEHENVLHGESVYDEVIRFPLFVKFPGQTESVKITSQFYQKGIYDIVKKIISGELNQNNFKNIIENEINSPFIHSRNCANDITSLRYKNSWKLIQDFKANTKYLFDLKNDSKELINVSEKNPDMVAFLMENYIHVVTSQEKNRMMHACTEFNN